MSRPLRRQAAAPTNVTATAGNAQATVAWTAPADTGGAPITQFRIQVRTGTTVVRTLDVPATPTTAVVTGLTNGTAYNFRVRAITSFGLGVLSAPSNTVTPVTVAAAPGTPVATAGNALASLTWTAPADTGGSPITGYRIQVRTGTVVVVRPIILTGTATSATVAGLTNGTAYNFRVRAVTAVGLGALSAPSNTVTPATVPGAPVIGTAVTGAAGGALTATANWAAPATNGGSAITGYRVFALQIGRGRERAGDDPVGRPARGRTDAVDDPGSGQLPLPGDGDQRPGPERAVGTLQPGGRPVRHAARGSTTAVSPSRATAVVNRSVLRHRGQLHGDARGWWVQPTIVSPAPRWWAGDHEPGGLQQSGQWSGDGSPQPTPDPDQDRRRSWILTPAATAFDYPPSVMALALTEVPRATERVSS